MSHISQGPLSSYNSLADGHLNGFFSNSRMRGHLRKAGLITKQGEIVSENTYRLNMSRKEHKKHVKDMLAQAIVHKTLDLERMRQAEIRMKLEEIAKIELVRRVRAERSRHLDDALLPYLSPRAASVPKKSSARKSTPSRSPSTRGRRSRREHCVSNGNVSSVHERASRYRRREEDILPLVSPRSTSRPLSSPSAKGQVKHRYRPISAPARKGRRPTSALSSTYEDDEEVIYLDDEGRPITPAHVDESEIKYTSKDPIDTRHLYSLDTAALRKYAMLMSKMEQGQGGLASPYLLSQVPIPPKSPRSGRTPRSAQRYRSREEMSKSSSPKRPATALHPSGSIKRHRGQQETMCEVYMCYHGSNLSLAREQFDKRQDIVVEQQHCGGNTLTVFRDKLEPDTKFHFISYRHRGYPFSLSIYIDGKMNCRVSTCCEYRHQKGCRIGGKKGQFSITRISGAIPCYKCQVEKGIRIGNQAPRPKLKRPIQQQEEVVVLETKAEEPPPQRKLEHRTQDESPKTEILVPVDDVEDKSGTKAKKDKPVESDKYEDDFESSSSDSSDEEEDYTYNKIYSQERGDDGYVEDAFLEGKKQKSKSETRNEGAKSKRIKSGKRETNKERLAEDKRGSKTTKSPKKTKGKSDDVSDSSCADDEDYYEYKKRMLKKIDKKEKRSKDEEEEEEYSEDFTDEENSGTYVKEKVMEGKKENEDRAGKKKSSASSVVGQAETVKASSKQAGGGGSGSKGGRPHSGARRGGGAASGGNDAGDTADEVSDIESEMAASPRKSDTVGNLQGPDYNSDGSGSGGRGDKNNCKVGVGRKDGKESDNSYSSRSEPSSGSSSPGKKDRTPHKKEKRNKSKKEKEIECGRLNETDRGETETGRPRHTQRVGNNSVSPSWQRVMDNADGQEKGLQLDLGTTEYPQRGDGAFSVEDAKTEADSDSRGNKDKGWSEFQNGLGSRYHQNTREHKGLTEDEVRAGLRDAKPKRAKSAHSSRAGRSDKPEKSERKSRQRSIQLKEEVVSAKQDECVDDVAEDGASCTREDNERPPMYEDKPMFEGKITTIPMVKTGENEYLKKQAEEEVERRKKSESLKKNLADKSKRDGKYFNDLSPRDKVIRGYVGDSCSDNSDDEMYEKLIANDERAKISDDDQDFAGPKDYILTEANDTANATKLSQSCNLAHDNTVELEENSAVSEETPQYRVLVDTAKEVEERERKERKLREQEEKEILEKKKKDDVRGYTEFKRKNQNKSALEGTRNGENKRQTERIHPSLLPKPQHSHNGTTPKYMLNYPRFDSEGEMEPRPAMANGNLKQPPENLMFRHTFIEEPTPRLYRPGIDDRDIIQTQYHTSDDTYTKPIDNGEVNSPAVDCEAEPSEQNQPIFGERNVLNTEAGGQGESLRSQELKTSQNADEFDRNAEIVGTKYVDNEEDRYVKHHNAFDEAPVVDDEEFFETGKTLSVLRYQDIDGAVAEKNPSILSLSVNTLGEKYDAEDIRLAESRRANKMQSQANNKDIPALQDADLDRNENVENKTSEGRIQAGEKLQVGAVLPKDGAEAKEHSVKQEMSVPKHAEPGEIDASGANEIEKLTFNDSEPGENIYETENEVILSQRKSPKRSGSVTPRNVMDLWLGRAGAAEAQEVFNSVMNESFSSENSPRQPSETQPETPMEFPKEPESPKEPVEPEGQITHGDTEITSTNLMNMWLGGQQAREARPTSDSGRNNISDVGEEMGDKSNGDENQHVASGKRHEIGEPFANNDDMNRTLQSDQADIDAVDGHIQPDQPVKGLKDTCSKEGGETPRDGSDSDVFTDDDAIDDKRRRESNYMADESSDTQSDSDKRRSGGSSPDIKKKRKSRKRLKPEVKEETEFKEELRTTPLQNEEEALKELYSANVQKGSVPDVVVTSVEDDVAKVKKSKDDGVDEDDDKSYVSDASGIDALIECLEEQLSDSKRIRSQSESGSDYLGENAKNDLDFVDGDIGETGKVVSSYDTKEAASPRAASHSRTGEFNGQNKDIPMVTGAFSVQVEEELSGTTSSETVVKLDNKPDATSEKNETRVSEAADENTDGVQHGSISTSGKSEDLPAVDEKNAVKSAHSKLVSFIDDVENNTQQELQRKSPDSATVDSTEFESISGENEDDAARRYVENMLSRIQGMTVSEGRSGSEMPSSDLDKRDSNAKIAGLDGQKIGTGEFSTGVCEDTAELARNGVPSSRNMVDRQEAVTTGSKAEKEGDVSPKGSSLSSPHSEHGERRRQRKLTVSFAAGESHENDDGHTEAQKSVPWEEATDAEREAEYEKLEMQIERSLVRD